MATITVAVINASTVLSDAEVQTVVAPLQTQVNQHFAPAWGVDATLTFVGTGGTPQAGAWWLTILNDTDQAGALGYHDLTSEGLPLAKVFARTDQQAGLQWTVTASHELLEMLADPDIDLSVFEQPSATTGAIYAYEICDPCEDDGDGYTVDGTLLSDFVYPAWFESFRQPGSTTFDYQQKIAQPFQLLPGGYISYFDVTAGSGWQQKTQRGGSNAHRHQPQPGSRRERRYRPRDKWKRSTAHAKVHAK